MSRIRIGRGRHRVVQWSGIRVSRAEGSWIECESGRRYLDFFGASGVSLLGHSHPRVARRLSDAVSRNGIGAFPNEFEDALLLQLEDLFSGADWDIELFSGGAEAVEAALRLATEYTGRSAAIGFSGGFHGRTAGARTVTEGSSPRVPSMPFAIYPDCHKCPLALKWPSCEYQCLDHTRSIIEDNIDNAGAVIVEPLQGRSGNIVPPEGYLQRLAELTRSLGLLLILDETLTCLGRTGYTLAHDSDSVEPDVVILGKGLGNGYPVSALAVKRAIYDAVSMSKPSGSSSSYGGFPAASAAASATLEVLDSENLVARAKGSGYALLQALSDELSDCRAVERVTGRGMAIGIHFSPSMPSEQVTRKFFDEALRRGLIVMLGSNCARLYPPLNLSESDLGAGIERICAAAWCLV